jgi:hypothetical protein
MNGGRLVRSIGGAAVMMIAASVGACAHGDAAERDKLVDAPAARRLVGVWDIICTNDRRGSIDITATSSVVSGMLAFTTDHHGPTSADGLSDITNDGTYDLDFQPFGWTTRDAGAPAVAVAKVIAAQSGRSGEAHDSLYLVLSPGTERFAVHMAGTIAEDSASGEWSARAYSAGGGAGRFVMRRHATPTR